MISYLHLLEDGSTIVGHGDLLACGFTAHALENFVHSFGSEGSLDQVGDGNGAHK